MPQLDSYIVEDRFWSPRLLANREHSIFTQWERYEGCGTIDNFHIAAGLRTGARRGFFYTDSDLHKWADAACRILRGQPDPRLSALVEGYAQLMGRAQEADGYLFTYNQVHFPGTRWKNLMIEHELYCHGHFIEAGISNRLATGQDGLLGLVLKSADLIVRDFREGSASRTSGHEEIELALIKLYRLTREKSYLDTAAALLERRGRTSLFGLRLVGQALSQAARSRVANRALEGSKAFGFDFSENLTKEEPPFIALRSLAAFIGGSYHQQHAVLRTQLEPKGHAVRWAYLMCAAAMLARETGEEALCAFLRTAWERLVDEKMYVTGGIGALPVIEGFGRPWELDNHFSYSETCAAVGSVFWNREMSLPRAGAAGHRDDTDARYADLIEWQLANAAIAGISIAGDAYLYRNPLASRGGLARRPWYATACCPSNISRLLADLDLLAFALEGRGLRIDQYLSGSAILDDGTRMRVVSDLPWGGRVRLELESPRPLFLRPRIPGWVEEATILVDGQPLSPITREPATSFGAARFARAAYLEIRLGPGRRVVEMDFMPRICPIAADPRVKADRGRLAVTRGSLVYCAESTDNPGRDLEELVIDPGSLRFEMTEGLFPLPCGGIVGTCRAGGAEGVPIRLIPYAFWGNRGDSAMAVWLNADLL